MALNLASLVLLTGVFFVQCGKLKHNSGLQLHLQSLEEHFASQQQLQQQRSSDYTDGQSSSSTANSTTTMTTTTTAATVEENTTMTTTTTTAATVEDTQTTVEDTQTGLGTGGETSPSRFVLYKGWSKNLNYFGKVSFYTGYISGNPTQNGLPYDIGFEAHLQHGFATKDGQSLIGVGHGLKGEGTSERNMVVVKVNASTGIATHVYKSPKHGDNSAAASGEYTDSQGRKYVLVAGFSQRDSGTLTRTLTKLKLDDLTLVWDTEIVGASGGHSTYEGIAVDPSTGVWLGGAKNTPSVDGFDFKSAGGLIASTAFVSFFSNSKLDGESPPTSEDYVWSSNQWFSVRALDLTTEVGEGYVIAALHKENITGPKAALLKLKAEGASSSVVWGPTYYGGQAEITDVAVAPDGSGYLVTGHGMSEGIFTRVGLQGNVKWTTNISLGNPEMISTKCWSVQPAGHWGSTVVDWKRGPLIKEWIASCASGIRDSQVCGNLGTADMMAACVAGKGDPSNGAPRRAPGVWTNHLAVLEDSVSSTPGDVIAKHLSSFLGENASPSPDNGSSAAEWIAPIATAGSNSDWFVLTKESFGPGFMRMQLGAASQAPTDADQTDAGQAQSTTDANQTNASQADTNSTAAD
eukprot:TRINITY_DN7890_c5_g1_i1.p1 TRINITY_DN7890_c5_g1~~TRINITY_DN7890_c5_g1_i1.p1  ORF type:complete len:634 (-),score=103.53 TRINITY_DN7890_c5_g1_i1:69-1970(-)